MTYYGEDDRIVALSCIASETVVQQVLAPAWDFPWSPRDFSSPSEWDFRSVRLSTLSLLILFIFIFCLLDLLFKTVRLTGTKFQNVNVLFFKGI